MNERDLLVASMKALLESHRTLLSVAREDRSKETEAERQAVYKSCERVQKTIERTVKDWEE